MADELGSDGLPYTILSYANGKGYANTYNKDDQPGRPDLSKLNFNDLTLEYPATTPNIAENHGGEDVGVYSFGPLSEIFVGNYEQSNIALAMAYALKVGPYAIASENTCHSGDNGNDSGTSTTESTQTTQTTSKPENDKGVASINGIKLSTITIALAAILFYYY